MNCRQPRILTTATITSKEVFKGLRHEWNELLGASNCRGLFLTWEWLHTWWTHLGDDRTLYIIAVRDNDLLVALVPLAQRPSRLLRLMPFRALEFLGSGNVGSDYLNLIVRDGYEQDAIRVIAGCLTECGMALQLSQVERMTPQLVDLSLQLRQLGWHHPRRTTVSFCPYIKLADRDWDGYLMSLGRSHRGNFRRRLRKLSSGFKLTLERADTDEQRRDALAILIALHLKLWGTRGGSDALHREELLNFHAELTQTALHRNWLQLYVMRIDDKPVAALYGFLYHDVFYFYQSGFDVDYSDYSIGLVMLGLVIKEAIANGAREFDFLHGEERYKYLWARDERELVRFDLFPPHATGSLCNRFMQLRESIKRMVRQWRPSRYGQARPELAARENIDWDEASTRGGR